MRVSKLVYNFSRSTCCTFRGFGMLSDWKEVIYLDEKSSGYYIFDVSSNVRLDSRAYCSPEMILRRRAGDEEILFGGSRQVEMS